MNKASLSVSDGIRGIAAKDQIIRNVVPPQVRLGFTLIELLIVVVIIGILAGIVIPRYASVREKSYMAAVMSDLKVMATQMEIYQSDNWVYAANIGLLVDFTASEGVTITIIARVTPTGRYYGAINSTHIAAELSTAVGRDIDRRWLDSAEPIREPGEYDISLTWANDITATIHVVAAVEE